MLLYLRHESLFRIDTIELIDGCYPRITYDVGAYSGSDGVRSPPPTEEYSVSDLNIEPAIWGIILILDRVCVDVKRRRFSWATTSVGKIDDEDPEGPSYRTHYADDERYEYDDNIDELFNLANHLITVSHSRTNNTRESQEEQSSLIRMLYCCILPKIQIYQKDHKKVEDAIKNQMSYIRKIEHDIERDSQVLNKLYEVLYKQQDERLQQFACIVAQKKCTKKFVMVLDEDLEKRKHKLREQIDANQGIVQRIKIDIQKNGETEEKRCHLQNARDVTAHFGMILQKILVATVDTMKGVKASEDFQLHDNETVVVDYLKSKEMSENQKMKAKRQMEKKVRATSILENLKRIKEDINTDGVATPTITSTFGIRPTDVISDSHLPEYQTLSERVADIVKNPEHPLGEEFAKFTNEIRECCQDILDDAESWRKKSERKRNSTRAENGYLVIENDGTMQEEYQIPLEKLCEKIKEHSDRMAQLLLAQFSSSSDVLKRKLQLCYEENFYNEVNGDITKVYEIAFKKYKEKMIHDLELLSTYPIKCLDLGMKDEWWLELFEKRRQATIARHRSVSNPIQRGSAHGDRNRISSDSSTPPESESSSSTSSSSGSSGSGKRPHASSKNHQSTRVSSKEQRKISSFFSFIRRKSREISDSFGEGDIPDEKRNGKLAADTCYDNYHGDTSYQANKMSGAIKARIPNGTKNNEHDKTLTASDNGMCLDDEGEAAKVETPQYDNELSKFAKYFGPSLDCLKDVFEVSPVFSKLKCLTQSLTKVTDAVQELRQQVLERFDDESEFSLAITADDLLPLMVLIMLQMDAADAASMVVELKMMQDLIPRFLSFGCHGWALVEFDMASKVLHSLCTQFDWSTSFSKSF